ncbi:MAG: mandelate racemase/muconate lactonizing enzyme family protein [Chloroflexi bacterium]|nr:mandelate racemase/muconate lactonizing enzyme family protein [Chloroflexota bacterium]
MSLEPYTAASELIVEVFTDEGLVGIGEVHGKPMAQIAALLQGPLLDLVRGRDPLETEAIWQEVFALGHTRRVASLTPAGGQGHFGGGSYAQLMSALAGLDLALWDLKGRALDQPVYRLLGGNRTHLPAYATGGYYQDGKGVDDLVREVVSYVEGWGYRAVKLKVGGVPIAEDVERLRAVRQAFPALEIMVDANSAYDVPTAIAAARAFEPIGIRWLEEPVHWYDAVFGLGRVSAATSIPTASGESELHRWGCRDLIDNAGIQIVQFDCTRAGGLTEGLKVAAYAASKGVWFAPHHDPQIHGHLVSAIPNGLILETFPDRERDPLWQELFEEKPVVADGFMALSDRPGWGVTLNRRTLERYRA